MLRLHRLFFLSIALTTGAIAEEVSPDFERIVAPLLESRCLSCHDAETAKGEFDLSSATSTLAHTGALLPGDAASSLIVKMVSGPEPEMPKKGNPLTAAERKILADWINAGAPWSENRTLVFHPTRDLEWWSLKPIREGHLPETTLPGRNPVDSLIEAKLAEKGLTPLDRADSPTLIRRVTFDLTGLPPTPVEVDDFLHATATDPEKAWTRLVDRLLASPAFGEKFAQHWLDLARYAESHGYDKDKPRTHAWPYRDYVIRSFNEDKPYRQFVEEQVAGDVLFPGSADGIIGLGFLAAGPWDFIGHQEVGEAKVDGRIAKHLDRDEMISAVFNVFQSTTVQCAQCHYHKFDPIGMDDYYRLHAVFAAVDRADRVYSGLPPEQEKERLNLTEQLNRLKKQQGEIETGIQKEILGKSSKIDLRLTELKTDFPTKLSPQYGYHSGIASKEDEPKWVQIDLGKSVPIHEIRVYPAYDDYAGIGAGSGFPIQYRVDGSDDPLFKTAVIPLLETTTRDRTATVLIPGTAQAFRFVRLTTSTLAERKNDYALALGEIEIIARNGRENLAIHRPVTSKDSIESAPRWGRQNLVDGIYHREVNDKNALTELQRLRTERSALVESLRSPETEKQLAEIKNKAKTLAEKLKTFPEGELVYAAATHFTAGGRFTPTGGKPRPIHLLHRGDISAPGDLLSPGAPPLWAGTRAQFFENNAGVHTEGEARGELAHYLTDPANPLMSRSIANRLWQWTLGAPLVETPNDFGRGGLQPSDPKLLDFLADRLLSDPDQSLKAILRLILTSETYRRAVGPHPANAEIDGANTFLWRANRRRMTAEEYRDSVLAVSGLLRPERGGPSFQDFLIEKPEHSPHYQYHLHDPNDPVSHRRTIYRFVVRSQPQPMLTTLDCADPSMSVPSRDESTTALQALTQWNSRFVEAMSVHFAERLNRDAPGSAGDKVNLACRLALGRLPEPEERALLLEYLQTDGPESFARVVFNLNAFVYVE